MKNEINDLWELLKRSAILYGDKPALITNTNGLPNIISYYDFEKMVLLWVGYFRGLGINGQKIVLLGGTSAYWVITLLGIVCSGNIAIVIDGHEYESSLQYLLDTQSIWGIVYGEKNKLAQEYSENKLPAIDFVLKNDNFKRKIQAMQDVQFVHTPHSEDIAIMPFTSGTNKRPKLVSLSHKNLSSDIMLITQILGDIFSAQDAITPILPVSHMLGLTVSILTPIYYGAHIHFGNTTNTMSLIKDTHPSVIVAVPMILESILNYIKSTAERKGGRRKSTKDAVRMLFPNLKYIICGGAHLRAETVEEYRLLGITVLQGYGTTECSPVISVNSIEYSKPGSVGKVNTTKYCQVCINNGEIVVSGDIVAREYSDGSVLSDCFPTGDLGIIDEDGYLFITGRKGNIINLSNGINISPEPIEELMMQMDTEIKAVLVCALYDEKIKQDVLSAIIVPHHLDVRAKSTLERFTALIKKYNSMTAQYAHIHKLLLRQKDFSRTSLQKIQRRS